MQSLHIISKWIWNRLATAVGSSTSLYYALCVVTVSFFCSLKAAFVGTLANDLHRIKENYLRRMEAQAGILEAEAQIKLAESQKKFAEAISVASRIDTRAGKRALRLIQEHGVQAFKKKK